jgi:hypothetical protein
VSTGLLNKYGVEVLKKFSSRDVTGDGNCFFRSVSLALYGTQDYHAYLRAVTAFHLIENQRLYDINGGYFVMHDTCVYTPCFRMVVNSALTDGTYAELVHIFALSDALGMPIQSYCTPGTHKVEGIHPYTLRIHHNEFDLLRTYNSNEVGP